MATNISDSNNDGIGDGGGIYNGSTSLLTISNTIVADNKKATTDNDIVNDSGTVTSDYNIIEFPINFATGSNDTTGEITSSLYLDATLQNNGGFTQTLALLSGSIAIDAGTETGAPESDQRGYTRLAAPDIGAYEYTGLPLPRYYVDASAVSSGYGDSWETAIKSLQDALLLAPSGSEIWVKAGTYYPTGTTDRTVSFELKEGVSL